MRVIQHALASLRRAHESLRQAGQISMVVVALAIGLLGGFCAVGFRLFIRYVNQLVWRQGPYSLAYIAGLPFWWKLAVPTAGGLVVGLIIHHFSREAKGHGVPEVMEAVALRAGRIRPRVVAAKLVASGISIGTGGSVGREGPMVQIGAALGSAIGQWLRIDQRRLRTLVGCGAAAGIAATFNAPVAGALFAVEILLGDFGVSQFSPIVISSVAATVVSHRYFGDFPAFEVTAYSLVHATELFAYAALGIVAGFAAVAFIRVLYGLEDLFDRVRAYPPLLTALGGFLIGIMGLWAPHVFGVGYEAINEALRGNLTWEFMLLLVVLKILAVSITIGSGGSGGILAPSLFIGAMLGGAVGTVVSTIWPAATGGPGAYALVGMGAIVAAATHAPITAILIIFELTGDYAIILPLMISCILGTLIASRLQRESIYTLKLHRRGIDVHGGQAVNVLQHVPARTVMREGPASVRPGDGLATVLSKFIDHAGTTLFVTDTERQLLGLVSADEVRPVMRNPGALEGLVIAADVMVADGYPRVSPDRPLADVMRLMQEYRGEIPVVEADRLVGAIWPEDVIGRYHAEIFKRDMVGSMVSAVAMDRMASVPAGRETVVAEVPTPAEFVGRTIRELDVRRRCGVSVLLIRKRSGDDTTHVVASPDYRFQAQDHLLVLGAEEKVRLLGTGVVRDQ
jgi:chloride channel protein, CIC family